MGSGSRAAFAGGDGTARDVYNVIGNSLPGRHSRRRKIHSAVYADTPAHAGDAAALFLSGSGRIQMREAEVMDIDEDAFAGTDYRQALRLYDSPQREESHAEPAAA